MPTLTDFETTAQNILALPIQHHVNALGGYGPAGEVIFEQPPFNCPSSLAISAGNATATFLTNGSVDFEVKHPDGLAVHVLEGSFDPVEKRETGVPSANAWLGFSGRFSSIINPNANWNLPPLSSRIIKTSTPRAIWFCAAFAPQPASVIETATRLTLTTSPHGPILQRDIYLRNTGPAPLTGHLWTYFHLRGTQRFVYHKPLWYDLGLPLSPTETVTVARMPGENLLQMKRVSSQTNHLLPIEVTCDYASFVGDSSAFSLFPQALQHGRLLKQGAKGRLNRFTTPNISASRFAFDLQPGESASLCQALLYLTDETLIDSFRQHLASADPGYNALETSFRQASLNLIEATSPLKFPKTESRISNPEFRIDIPSTPATSAYLNSLWLGVDELYEKCRAHGATLADGIEVGTRDRAQDMFARMKSDPARVRADLAHAFSFMYVTDDTPALGRLTLPQKLHGLFPRQYPSRWLDRTTPVQNDNRPYADSPLWLIDALLMYLRETGDTSILHEQVETIRLTDPEHPETSAILGAEKRLSVAQVVIEIFAAYRRHVDDSPYGLAQILFGDWCDPVDMFGTDVVGDPSRRGHGRGAQVRLSAHLCICLVQAIDTFFAPNLLETLGSGFETHLTVWKTLADQLRQNILRVAWAQSPLPLWGRAEGEGQSAFIDCLHELNADGSIPNYANGATGYTIGSLRGTDFDSAPRLILTTQAYCLEMLRLERDYLTEPAHKTAIIQSLLNTVDETLFHPELGLLLFSAPVPNTRRAVEMVGRMGIVPAGCAENGEYHHAQMFMHVFRLNLPGQADTAWEQFQPLLSVGRDERLGGPFDLTSNSYASDPADPHFGAGMYFGLSGSVDWIVELLQSLAGLRLALHDDTQPDLTIEPRLPAAFAGRFTFQRVIHHKTESGYRSIPLTIRCEPSAQALAGIISINGKQVPAPTVPDVSQYAAIELLIATGQP